MDADAPPPRDRPAAAGPRPGPVGPGGTLQRVTPVDACALPALGQLLVSTAGSARMHWLNSRAWTVYSLCDGRDLDSLYAAYARAAGLSAGSAEAGRHVSDSVRHLVASGLVTHAH
ncbi:hypothetical protein ACFQ2B_07210 [Streptomyces stramineus]